MSEITLNAEQEGSTHSKVYPFYSKQYFQLIWYMVGAELRAERARTYIGFLILKTKIPDYISFLFIGLVAWRWFHATIMHASRSILVKKNILTQVYLPKYIYPVVIVLSDTVKFLLVFAITILFVRARGFDIGASYSVVAFVIFTEFILILGISLLVAGITPFIPDVPSLLEHVLRMLMYLSGVMFAIDRIHLWFASYLAVNPMVVILNSFRDIMMYNQFPSFNALFTILLLGVLLCVYGIRLIKKYDVEYPKIAL